MKPKFQGKATTSAVPVVLLLSTAVFVGCTNQEGGWTPSHLEGLAAPSIQPGQFWHYRGPGGVWQNLTVEAKESFHGFAAFRVDVAWWGPGAKNQTHETFWMEERSLGKVGSRQGAAQSYASCPTIQLLPLASKRYYCDLTVTIGNHSSTRRYDIEVTVGALRKIPVGGRTFNASEITSVDRISGDQLFHGWYTPEILYLAKTVSERKASAKFELEVETWGEHK